MEEADSIPASPATDQTPPQSPNQGFSHDMLGACHFCGSEEVVDTNCVHWPPRCPALMCYAPGCQRPDTCYCSIPDDTPWPQPHALAAESTKRALAPSLASASPVPGRAIRALESSFVKHDIRTALVPNPTPPHCPIHTHTVQLYCAHVGVTSVHLLLCTY